MDANTGYVSISDVDTMHKAKHVPPWSTSTEQVLLWGCEQGGVLTAHETAGSGHRADLSDMTVLS